MHDFCEYEFTPWQDSYSCACYDEIYGDLIPKEIGYFTMSQIYNLAIYAYKVNPMMTYEVKTFDNFAIVVHRIKANYTFCGGNEGPDTKENINE